MEEKMRMEVLHYSITKSEKTGQDMIMCLGCGRVSHNPYDVMNKYCGHCHVFHEEEMMRATLMSRPQTAPSTAPSK